MALIPCDPCDCIPSNIGNDKFKQDVENMLCQALNALGYIPPQGTCDPCGCIPANIPNDKFKQDVEVLLCALISAIGGGGGGGTVTDFIFTNANGISGVVATSTSTPTLTLSLGAITPTTIVASGAISGFNLSGTNTGDQTITLTGDVTGSGTGSFAATIANDAVTFAKIQNITTARLLGRATAGAGDTEEITLGTGLSFTGTTLNASGAALAITALTGDVTATGPGSVAGTIANDAVTYAKIQNVTSARLLGRATAGAGDTEEITLGTGLSFTGTTLNASGAGIIEAIGATFDGGGSAITTGIKGYISVPYACTINSVVLLADQTGSIVVDIWKDVYASFPPVGADSITAAAKPTISAATNSQDTTLTGWTTAIAAGDVLAFNVDSASTLTRVNLILKVTRT